MDLDGALMQFPRFRADLDKVMAWIKRQDPTFDSPTPEQRAAAANGLDEQGRADAQPITRGEFRRFMEATTSDLAGYHARLDERMAGYDERFDGMTRRGDEMESRFASLPKGASPANPAAGATAGQSTEKIDQNAKDGIVRAGSDLNDPSNQNRPAGDQPNTSGAREAMSAQFQAPNLDDGTGPNGRPTVDHATGASAAEVAAATGGSSAPQRAPSGAFPGAGGTDAFFDAAKTAGGGENPAVARPDGHTEGESTGSFVRPPQATPQSSRLEGTFGGNGRPFLEDNAARPLGPSPG